MMCCSISGAVLKRRKCSDIIMCQSQCRVCGKGDKKENTEEMKVQPNLYTIHAKCVITIPKDIQLAHNTCGKELSSADETTVITSEDDTIIIGEIKS